MKEPGPDHPITIAPYQGKVVVRFAGEVVAETANALELREASYRPVIYVPRADMVGAHFERSDHRTYCPYKGEASYFHLVAAGKRSDNAVWSYENPYPTMKAIGGHVAFYADRVSMTHT